jgi:hypothetical protein
MQSSGKDAIIFCAGAALGAGAIFYITERVKRINTNPYASIIFTANGTDHAAEVQLQALPSSTFTAKPLAAANSNEKMINFDKDDVLVEQLTRNVQFFGLEGQKKIANAFVVVVGLGVSRAEFFIFHFFNNPGDLTSHHQLTPYDYFYTGCRQPLCPFTSP